MFLIIILIVRYAYRARAARTHHTTIADAAPCHRPERFTDEELAWFRAPLREGQ